MSAARFGVTGISRAVAIVFTKPESITWAIKEGTKNLSLSSGAASGVSLRNSAWITGELGFPGLRTVTMGSEDWRRQGLLTEGTRKLVSIKWCLEWSITEELELG